MKNGPWISAGVQAWMDPPLIPLMKVELEEHCATHIIKFKIQINPSQAMSETNNKKISTLDKGQA